MNKDHLKEVAKDIRTNLEYGMNMLTEIYGYITDVNTKSTMDAIDYRLKNVERALTRIDMCLRETEKSI